MMGHKKADKETKIRSTPTGDFATIIAGCLYFEDVRQGEIGSDEIIAMFEDKYLTAVRVVSLEYSYRTTLMWGNGAKTQEQLNTEMTLRKESRGEKQYWYAYRRVHTKLHKRYVGDSERITNDRLLQVAQSMPSI